MFADIAKIKIKGGDGGAGEARASLHNAIGGDGGSGGNGGNGGNGNGQSDGNGSNGYGDGGGLFDPFGLVWVDAQADAAFRTELARNRHELAGNLLAQQQYTSGLVDFQTVLETQRSLLSAQDSVVSTEASLLQDHVRLYKALGGGWSPESSPVSGNTDNGNNESKISQAGKQ